MEVDQTTSDRALLARVARHADRDAMEEIVRRHIGMVHSSARRQVGGDSHLAEDVTQAVFILLARKAGSIHSDASLAGWLFNTTRFASANARKLARRRSFYERQAALRVAEARTDANAELRSDLLPHLDDAIAALAPLDRDSVILSFFHGHTYAQVGQALGATEEAARKRVTRALDRMRSFFSARGLLPASPEAVGSVLSVGVVAAPAQLTQSTLNLMSLTGPAAGTGAAGMIAKGVNHMWMLAKVKVAAVVAGAAIVGGAVTAQTVLPPSAPQPKPVVYASAAADPETVDLGNGVTLRFLGLCRTRDESWFTLSGEKVSEPAGRFRPLQSEGENEYAAMFRIEGFAFPSVEVKVTGDSSPRVNVVDDGQDAQVFRARFTVPQGQTSADLQILVSTQEWQTIGTVAHQPGESPQQVHTPQGSFVFTHVSEREGRSLFYVATDYKAHDFTVFAVDNAGKEHFCMLIDGGPVGSFSAVAYVYDLAPDQIASFAVKSRAYNHRVTAKDITLDPANPKHSLLKVEAIEKK